MRDEETGSWWQQISGEAIQGALKGQKLKDVEADEISYGIWKRENPNGRVLRPDEEILKAQKYESADWENQVGKMPVRVSNKLDESAAPRTIVAGVVINDRAKAYTMDALEKESPIVDTVGGKDIVVFLADDKKSVRAFERVLDGRTLEFFIKPDSNEIVDAETGSVWDFSGKASGGTLSGKELNKIQIIKDYWFDWKTYHPQTQLYTLGNR